MAATEAITQLANQYMGELDEMKRETLALRDTLLAKVDVFEFEVQQYQQQLNELQPVVNQQKDELILTLKDQSELSGIDNTKLAATFTWTSIMLFGMTIGFILSKYILAPVLSLFISGFYAALAAYAVIPAVAYYYLAMPAEGDVKELDTFRRHCLLGVAFVEVGCVFGMLNGFLFSERAIPGLPPPAPLAAFAIGIGPLVASSFIANFFLFDESSVMKILIFFAPIKFDNSSDRMKLMAVTLGGAFAADLVMGFATGLSTGFLILALLYTAAGFVVLQVYLKKGNGEAATHIYQLAFLVAVIYSQGIAYSLLSQDANESSSSSTE
ncbi:unnamed protein product [Toxocara canis]|uniref:Transmembrane protein n=1 Tax=Toxocara canis TaxID=6265 RepID=A0A183V143_TOXCA|nr:unnamed protein product [Toxocara canis]